MEIGGTTMPSERRTATTASRRASRVPRHTLSRPRIVEAALVLLDNEGSDAVTMPKLAKHLGVGTMSLYRHVADKDDLINAVAEHVLSGVAVPDGAPGDWERRVVGYLRDLRQAALDHPALSRILAERGLTAGPVFEQLEAAHAVLRAAGFSDLGAVRTFYALLTYVFGFVVWELPRVHQQPAALYTAAWNDAIDQLDPADYPNLRALRRQLTTTASSDQFDYGLEHLLRSLHPPG
jgi:TetR/AcrR family transcriptional regulator, tetracycline repressor protein